LKPAFRRSIRIHLCVASKRHAPLAVTMYRGFQCAFALHLMCVARLSTSERIVEPSQQVRNLIMESRQIMGGSVPRATAATFQFDSEMLSSISPRELNSNVGDVIRKANGIAAEMTHATGGGCKENWGAACPDGWQLVGKGSCKAPPTYAGQCGTLQHFENMNILDKRSWSATCDAPWPCSDECTLGRDYDDMCPIGWDTVWGGLCRNSQPRTSSCADVLLFEGMPTVQKQSLGELCNISWPCRESCERDFSATCPEEWLEVSGSPHVCMAFPSYQGPCPSIVNTSSFTVNEAQRFAERCSVQYACK